ncbi:MAG: hypothetical protein ACQERD_11580 [Campylobacterota bacterium]
MELIDCPQCNNHKINQRIGTICPSCGYTVRYFENSKNRKQYGRFFALSILIPFFSFTMILLASMNSITFYISVVIAIYLAYYSCPIRYKEMFHTTYEKTLFGFIWGVSNSLILFMIYNLATKI